MTTVALGVFMFTLMILSLVVVLMVAKSKLVAAGDVNIVINDDAANAVCVKTGGTLLGALADRKIFIPSACGGKGSCGVCKVDVMEGGGAILPTEPPPHHTRRVSRGHPPLLPGQGQTGHEDPGAERGFQRPPVEVQGPLQSQPGNFYQRARSRTAARGRGAFSRRRLHSDHLPPLPRRTTRISTSKRSFTATGISFASGI